MEYIYILDPEKIKIRGLETCFCCIDPSNSVKKLVVMN